MNDMIDTEYILSCKMLSKKMDSYINKIQDLKSIHQRIKTDIFDPLYCSSRLTNDVCDKIKELIISLESSLTAHIQKLSDLTQEYSKEKELQFQKHQQLSTVNIDF